MKASIYELMELHLECKEAGISRKEIYKIREFIALGFTNMLKRLNPEIEIAQASGEKLQGLEKQINELREKLSESQCREKKYIRVINDFSNKISQLQDDINRVKFGAFVDPSTEITRIQKRLSEIEDLMANVSSLDDIDNLLSKWRQLQHKAQSFQFKKQTEKTDIE